MHLYTQSSSPNGQRVSIFMKEKGIELPTTEIDLRAAENLKEDYLQAAPSGQPIMEEVQELIEGDQLYNALKVCAGLLKHELEVLGHAQ